MNILGVMPIPIFIPSGGSGGNINPHDLIGVGIICNALMLVALDRAIYFYRKLDYDEKFMDFLIDAESLLSFGRGLFIIVMWLSDIIALLIYLGGLINHFFK